MNKTPEQLQEQARKKMQRKWRDWGSRAYSLGIPIDRVAATRSEQINIWIREGWNLRSKRKPRVTA